MLLLLRSYLQINEGLYELGKLAKQSNVFVQTHCSESDWEHQHVLDRCEN